MATIESLLKLHIESFESDEEEKTHEVVTLFAEYIIHSPCSARKVNHALCQWVENKYLGASFLAFLYGNKKEEIDICKSAWNFCSNVALALKKVGLSDLRPTRRGLEFLQLSEAYYVIALMYAHNTTEYTEEAFLEHIVKN